MHQVIVCANYIQAMQLNFVPCKKYTETKFSEIVFFIAQMTIILLAARLSQTQILLGKNSVFVV